MAQSLITTVSIFRAYMSNCSNLGDMSTTGKVKIDTGESNLECCFSVLCFQMSLYQLGLPGLDLICVSLAGLCPDWKFL